MNRLALGTAQFGLNYGIANRQGQTSLAEVKAILQFSKENKINTLDTAIAYGDSEQCLGAIGVKNWQVISKLPAVPEDCNDVAKWVNDAVDQSLIRLKTADLHGLLLHRPLQLLDAVGEQLYSALFKLKQEGIVKKIGISIYDVSELDALSNQFVFDIVQVPFSIFDQRLIRSGWLSRLNEQGIEVHVRSIFLQGLLLMKFGERPEKFSRWGALWSQWDQWLEQERLTPLQACLRYSLSFPQINKVIVGVDSLVQLKEILAAATGLLPLIPESLNTQDVDLINPANWIALD